MVLEEQALCMSMFTEKPGRLNRKFAPAQYITGKQQKVVQFN